MSTGLPVSQIQVLDHKWLFYYKDNCFASMESLSLFSCIHIHDNVNLPDYYIVYIHERTTLGVLGLIYVYTIYNCISYI